MKKLLTRTIAIILTLFLAIAAPSSAVLATTSDLFFGQDHAYTVIFRGNGEAITYAKIAFTNSGEEDQDKFNFSLSEVTPSELAIFQMKLPDKCIDYSSNYSNFNDRVCEKYAEADYTQDYYYSYSNEDAEYQKVTYDRAKSSGSYTLTLPTPVKPNKSSSLVIAYVTKDYVKESAGLFKFNYQTIKVDSRINTVKVAVDVDSDLILKGKKAEVDYGSSIKKDSAMSEGVQSFSSAKLNKVVGGIGSYTELVKEAKNLSRNESFSVKGEYSTSWFRLYLSSILTAIAIVVLMIGGIILLVKFLNKKNNKKSKDNKKNGDNDKKIEDKTLAELATEKPSINDKIDYAKAVKAGLLSSILGLVAIVGAVVLSSGIQYLYSNGLFHDDTSRIVVSLLFAIVSMLLIIVAFLAPIVRLTIKSGWRYLMPTILAEIMWFIVFIVLFFIFTFVFKSGLNDMRPIFY